MKTFVQFLMVALIVCAVLLYIVVNYSVKYQKIYECSGNVEDINQAKPTKLFVKYASYRWWVSLWSNSDGSLWWEVSKGKSYYEVFVEEFETGITIWDYNLQNREKDSQLGRISFLSGDIALDIGGGEKFTGICEAINEY